MEEKGSEGKATEEEEEEVKEVLNDAGVSSSNEISFFKIFCFFFF